MFIYELILDKTPVTRIRTDDPNELKDCRMCGCHLGTGVDIHQYIVTEGTTYFVLCNRCEFFMQKARKFHKEELDTFALLRQHLAVHWGVDLTILYSNTIDLEEEPNDNGS